MEDRAATAGLNLGGPCGADGPTIGAFFQRELTVFEVARKLQALFATQEFTAQAVGKLWVGREANGLGGPTGATGVLPHHLPFAFHVGMGELFRGRALGLSRTHGIDAEGESEHKLDKAGHGCG